MRVYKKQWALEVLLVAVAIHTIACVIMYNKTFRKPTLSSRSLQINNNTTQSGTGWCYSQDLQISQLVYSDIRSAVKESYFSCSRRIVLFGWHNDLIDPLTSFAKEIQRLSGCDIRSVGSMNGTLNINYIKDSAPPDFLYTVLRDADIVIWWNWRIDAENMNVARKHLSHQVWVLLNRDDPFSTFVDGTIHAVKRNFDVVFTSGTASMPTYLNAGVKEVHAFVPAIDAHHYYDHHVEFECDVAMIITQLYDHPGSPRNRTAIVDALVRDARQTGLRFHIYGPSSLGLGTRYPEFYKGPIDYLENRKVWSSAKISANFHVVDGYGGWYANARNTEILGSRGLLVVDRTVEGPLRHMVDCVFWRSDEPQDIVTQVHEILQNYGIYNPIKERGAALASTAFSSAVYATRVLAAISRVTSLQ